MKKLIVAALMETVLLNKAYSADFATTPVVESGGRPVPAWAGFYGGLFAGYGVLDSATRFDCIGPTGRRCAAGCPIIQTRKGADGAFIAGGEVGYNRLFGAHLLIGGAADYQFTRLWDYGSREGTFPAVGGGAFRFSTAHAGQRLDDLATLRGKVGLAAGRTLAYATGGLAVGNVRIDTTQSFLSNRDFDARRGEVRLGYVVGGGLEYAFSAHLSAKIEGLYYDLGHRVIFDDTTRYRFGTRATTDGILTRVGLNYRFGAGLPVLPPAGPRAGSGIWDFEGGLRYFYSSGGPRYTLGSDRRPGQVNSRLTYQSTDAHAGESFVRVDHNPTGLFAKGFLGSGVVTSGRLYDEDFPPALSPYTKTLSRIKDGDIGYGVVDLGYTALRRDGFSLGGFVGYQYDAELANGYGCSQVAGGTICARRPVPTDINVLSENLRWNALRIGLIGAARFDRFKLSLEGAYLPVSAVTGVDRHWLRPDINPLPQKGHGDGYFAEGILSYDLRPAVSVGVGGRYWRMQTGSGRIRFPFSPGSPTKFETDRYGAFAQIAYKLSDLGLGGLDGPPVRVRKD
ncbi:MULTISPECIES: porin family protein [unclassified Methylobacterium]|uniref:porin family protein n=1 Tax=unclassified Methylobacterium TaxID=2615210 RepID=UPI0011C1FEC1|nr:MULTISPECIES: porin family protein [unclassified Methylobacterium]QEE38940.1 porin family protein [Methylobacterium sp. WL1]TXN54895.1 porin family protein [Methylobacterium sp. WL2]